MLLCGAVTEPPSTLDFTALDEALRRAERDLDYDRYATARREAHAIEARLAGASTDEVRVRIAFARCLLVEGRSAERLGKTEEADNAVRLLQEVLRGDEPPLLAVEAKILQGVLLGSRGDIEAARVNFDEAEGQARQLHSPALLGWLISRKGVLHSWRGQQREALECLDQAALIEMQAERTHRMPVIENSIALCHLALGDLDLALELFRDTLLSARAVGNAWAEGLALVNMAEVFYESGDYGPALDLYRQTLEVARSIEADRLEGDALAWIGQIFNRLGDFAQARSHLQQAIEHHTAREDAFQTSVARICLAEVELDAGELELARAELEAGLEIADRLASGYLQTRGLLVRARLHRAMSAPSACQDDLLRAVTLSARLEERRLHIWARRDLALQEPDAATRAAGLQVALQLAAEHGFQTDRVTLMLAYAEAVQDAGTPEAALAAYRDYVGARERQFDQDSDFRLRQQQVLYAVEHARHEAERHRKLSEQLEAANRELQRLATTDALTQLSDRRHLWARAQAELTRARRNGSALSLISIDIDGLRALNDEHGHEVGDRVLVAVAAVFRGALRAFDLPGRVGGGEFCILLPETGLSAACEVAQRVCDAVRAQRVDAGGGTARVTVSAGVAGLSPPGEPLEQLMARAEVALLRAKAAGRDRVERG